jgi:hypothetical protein
MVVVAGSLPGRSLATLSDPTPAHRTDGKFYDMGTKEEVKPNFKTPPR